MGAIIGCASWQPAFVDDPTTSGFEITRLRVGADNAWLIINPHNTKDAILIDTGRPQNVRGLEEKIREAGVAPSDLDAIILTHGHFDHAGGAAYFQNTYGARVVAGIGDRNLIEDAASDELCPTIPFARRLAGAPPPEGSWGAKIDIPVEDTLDLSSISSINGKIIVLPGHTKGSLIVRAGDAVFVGDLIRGKAIGRGPARHLFMCDIADNDRDLAYLLDTIAPDAERFFPGHMKSFTRPQLERFLGLDAS